MVALKDRLVVPTRLKYGLVDYWPLGSLMQRAGSEAVSAGTSLVTADRKYVSQVTTSADGQLTSITFRLGSTVEATVAKGIVYTDSAGAPGALVATGTEVIVPIGAPAALASVFNSESLVAGTYWIGFHVQDTASGFPQFSRGSTGGAVSQVDDTYSDGPSDPFGSPSTATGPLDAFINFVSMDGRSHLYGGAGPHDLTNNNAVTLAAGPSNNLPDAASFVRGSSQSLSVDNAVFNPGTRPFGVAIWAYRSTEATDGFSQAINKYTAASRGWALNRVTSTNRWQFRCSSDGTNDTSTSGSFDTTADNGTETWNFVAGWWDGANLHCQVNMKAPLSIAFAGPVFASTAVLGMGGSASAFLWDGRLSMAHIWMNRVPTQAELRWLYNNGVGRSLARGC